VTATRALARDTRQSLSRCRRSRAGQRERQSLEVLGDLYGALVGDPPRALRVYRDNDALLLLRFDPELPAGADGGGVDSFAETSFMAMVELVAELVSARGGLEVVPGSLRVCAAGLRPRPPRGRAPRTSPPTCDPSSSLEKRKGGLRLAG
jgi:hypothetical protein